MPELAVEQKLGPYLLLREAGQGGMAIVFQALDTRTQETVAVKLLKTPLLPQARQEEMIARLGREAGTLARLSHPHVVALREGPRSEGRAPADLHYLVLEYLDGMTLRARLTQGRLSPDQILYLIEQVADALDALHGAGIVYRDLKPSNLMLQRDGDAKLIDFGMARGAKEPELNPSGTLVGSPAYLAPELIAGKPGTAASDIWSLGVLLYEMLTGQLPFVGDSIADVLRRIAHEPPAPLPPASAKIERVLQRALEKSPKRRYPSARALVMDYAKAIGVPTRWAAVENSPAAPVVFPASRSRLGTARLRPVLLRTGLAAGALLLITGLAAVPLLTRPALSPPPLEAYVPPLNLPKPHSPTLQAPVRVRVAAVRQERHTQPAPIPKAAPAVPRETPRLAKAAPASKIERAKTAPVRVAAYPPVPPAPRAAVTPNPVAPKPVTHSPVRIARAVTAPVAVSLPAPPSPLRITPQRRVQFAPAYRVTALGPLGDGVHGLNDRGESVGGLNGSAVLWDGGGLHRLNTSASLASYSEAAAINNRGQVVGFFKSHAFLWQDGHMQDLGTLSGNQSNAAAINDQGEVVGTSHNHAVLWRHGQVVDLGTLGGDESHARAINNRGQVAGVSYTPHGYYHAVLWQDGQMQDLGTLGGPSSMAVAINDQGQVAGLSVTASGATHAFLWQDGHMQDLGTLVGDSQAYGIGPHGEVVGASGGHAVLWRDGKTIDLDRLTRPDFDGSLSRAVAINAQGQILCYGRRRGSAATQAFLLAPSHSDQEPSSA